MFSLRRKSKTQRLEISWPVESNREPLQRGPLLPPLPLLESESESESSSTYSAYSAKSSPSSYSPPQHQYVSFPTPAPKYYSPVESNRGLRLPTPPPPPRPSSSKNSRHSPSSSQSSYPSHASTALTSYRPSIDVPPQSSCDDQSCHGVGEVEADQIFEQFRHQIDISDKIPDVKTLGEAGEIPIYDSEGNSRPFKSLYSGDLAIGEQQMVLFVRHFFCGACQAYITALCKAITLQTYFTLPIPTSITIIGLGSPELIPSYRRATGTQFAIYAEPTRKLYKALGMSWTFRSGPRCDYMKGINEIQWVKGQIKQVREEDKKLRSKGGNILWIGGEFMFKDGAMTWCHRMKNYRGHSDIEVIKRLLGVDDCYHAF